MTYFKGKVGEGHVKDYKYNISTEDGKSLDQVNDWSSVVKTGTVFLMSMVVEKVALDEGKDQAQRNSCPHCYKTYLGVMEYHGWLQW